MENLKSMRNYSHEELVNLISSMTEEDIIKYSSTYGGYPVLIRMCLDEKVTQIPFIQTGSAIICVNENGEVLIQERTDRNSYSLPGGCQEIAETLEETAVRELFEETGIKVTIDDLKLIGNVSGKTRRNMYPSGDIVYNNTTLFLVNVKNEIEKDLKLDSESKSLKFMKIEEIPDNFMDKDLIEKYIKFLKNN